MTTRLVDAFSPPFYVIPMPFNALGGGPEMDSAKVVGVSWEIWDDLCLVVCTTGDEVIAKLICQRLNT